MLPTAVPPQVVIPIPSFLTLWDLEGVMLRCHRRMEARNTVYILDMSGVKNVYGATVRLITRLHDRAVRLASEAYVINASPDVMSALCAMKVHLTVPVLGLAQESDCASGESLALAV